MTAIGDSDFSGRGSGGGDATANKEGLGLFNLLDVMRADIRKAGDAGLDYNGMTSAEKQVAQALIDVDQARFQTIGGRTCVVTHRPRLVWQLLTMGAKG